MIKWERPKENEKPRTRFCWSCSRKLYGNHFVWLIPEDNIKRTSHLDCAKDEVRRSREQMG